MEKWTRHQLYNQDPNLTYPHRIHTDKHSDLVLPVARKGTQYLCLVFGWTGINFGMLFILFIWQAGVCDLSELTRTFVSVHSVWVSQVRTLYTTTSCFFFFAWIRSILQSPKSSCHLCFPASVAAYPNDSKIACNFSVKLVAFWKTTFYIVCVILKYDIISQGPLMYYFLSIWTDWV